MSEKYNRQDSTIQYYNENADAFVSRTVDIDMSNIYPKFTSLLPCDGKILDAGCGSGRDAQYFLSQGFEVVAIDASEEMVKCASNLMGQDAVQMKFDDVTFSNEFDGVWACASLLHVKKENFVSTLNILVNALKSNGVIYVSLKESKSSTPDGGRHFSYFSIDEVNEIMSLQSELELLEIWIEERIDFKWVNLLARKNC
jgi:2-polyprenyl-3-methyl-5-hydroxy-6-metoxy-1,4-benzoquinol methylase